MARVLDDWLPAFVRYAGVLEAPPKMHLWSGVSAIAGALRKKVWLDMGLFSWTPCFYIVLVAPPGIIAKSTTADIALDLLREVPGIRFGPDAVTWQKLAQSFSEACEEFIFGDEMRPMSPITLVATELGNLINLQDREMVSFLITMWDCRKRYDKETKTSGSDTINSPWINLIACTTPNWVAENMPTSMIGGGLSSRCVFIYAEEKHKLVAYPDEHMRPGAAAERQALLRDLEHIAVNLCGPYRMTTEARVWGRAWYEQTWGKAAKTYDEAMLQGYLARKQTHLHKLAMVLSASRTDELVIDEEDLMVAENMLQELEADMPKVFSRIGQTETSRNAERLLEHVRRCGECHYEEAYKAVYSHFPNLHDFEAVVHGLLRSGQLQIDAAMRLRVKKGA